jgi:RNA polymerase sigma-70 factor (ECF subfamily)
MEAEADPRSDVSVVEIRVGARMSRDRAAEREAAFRRLMSDDLRRVHRLATAVLGSSVDAEDAVHDAAILAWRRFGSLRDLERFPIWFDRILVNVCRDRLRSLRRSRVVDLSRAGDQSDRGPGVRIEQPIEDRQAVAGALAALPPDQQIVLSLRYGIDLTVPAIAERLEIPEGTVKSRLHHALEAVRASIEAEERR